MKLSSSSVFTQYMLYITEHIFNGVLCFSHTHTRKTQQATKKTFSQKKKKGKQKTELKNRKTKLKQKSETDSTRVN